MKSRKWRLGLLEDPRLDCSHCGIINIIIIMESCYNSISSTFLSTTFFFDKSNLRSIYLKYAAGYYYTLISPE